MKKILFVDDERNVLEGLRRMLRDKRGEWDMYFATGGEEALALLAGGGFNVVVSDLRMPGLSGKDFLTRVAREYPDVVRVILSGQPDRDVLMESAGLAHQFLLKPCDGDLIRTTIENASGIRAILRNDALRELISRMDSLPALPNEFFRLLQELRSAGASVDRVGEIISRDFGMSAKVLQLANSAFFGLAAPVSKPAHAASLLGLDAIRALVLTVQVFKMFDPREIADIPLERMWQHGLLTGAYAQAIVRAEKGSVRESDDALMAGMLHDLGKLILTARLTREWRAAMRLVEDEPIDAATAERRVFGATHAELGGYLLGLWGMPYAVVEAVCFHHRPAQAPTQTFSLLAAVHAANALEHELHPRKGSAPSAPLDDQYLDGIGCAGRMPAWRDVCRSIRNEVPQWTRES